MEVVKHIRPGVETGRDRWNKPIFSDAATDVETLGVEPAQSVTDPQTGAITATSGFKLYLPPEETVGPDDRFTVRGKTYKVEGGSSDWTNPFTGWSPGNVVTLEKSEYIDG